MSLNAKEAVRKTRCAGWCKHLKGGIILSANRRILDHLAELCKINVVVILVVFLEDALDDWYKILNL